MGFLFKKNNSFKKIGNNIGNVTEKKLDNSFSFSIGNKEYISSPESQPIMGQVVSDMQAAVKSNTGAAVSSGDVTNAITTMPAQTTTSSITTSTSTTTTTSGYTSGLVSSDVYVNFDHRTTTTTTTSSINKIGLDKYYVTPNRLSMDELTKYLEVEKKEQASNELLNILMLQKEELKTELEEKKYQQKNGIELDGTVMMAKKSYNVNTDNSLYQAYGSSDPTIKVALDIKNLESQIGQLDTTIQSLQNEISDCKFEKIRVTDDYNNFLENDLNSITDSMIKDFSREFYSNPNRYDYILLAELVDEGKITVDILTEPSSSVKYYEMKDYYKYMTEDQRNMYHYIYSKGGFDDAQMYLESISDEINRVKGMHLANERFKKLDLTDEEKIKANLCNVFNVGADGLEDGIEGFFDGLENVFAADGKLSAKDYEKMFYLSYLQQNGYMYADWYSFNSSLGNMLPAMATSTLVSALATPVAGEFVGTSLMGLSAGGNAREIALQNGASNASSYLYGLLIGGSEATLGYFIGNVPGLSKNAAFTLKNMLMEGTEEYSQEWIQAGLDSVLLGKEFNFEETSVQAFKSFIMGVAMSSTLTGGQTAIQATIEGIAYSFNLEKTIEYLSNDQIIKNPTIEDVVNYCTYESNNGVQNTVNPNKVYTFRNSNTVYEIPVRLLNDYLNGMNADNIVNDWFMNNPDLYDCFATALQQYIYESNYNLSFTPNSYQRYINVLNSVSTIWNFIPENFNQNYTYNGVQYSANGTFYNNTLLNNNAYDSLCQYLNSTSSVEQIEQVLTPYELLYQQLIRNNANNIGNSIILNADLMNKLNYLHCKYKSLPTQFKSKNMDIANSFFEYSRFGTGNYGVNQGFFTEDFHIEIDGRIYNQREYVNGIRNGTITIYNNSVIRKVVGSAYESVRNRLIEQGVCPNAASQILTCLDSTGACSYAAICNGIFSQLNGRADIFKRIFGFDMYKRDSVTGENNINYGDLLADMYLYFNLEENGGQLFDRTIDGSIYLKSSAHSNDVDAFGRYLMDSSQQQYASSTAGVNSTLINRYLNSKNANYHLESGSIIKFESCGDALLNSEMQNCINDVEMYMGIGCQIHLGISRNSHGEINMKSLTEGVPDCSTYNWNEGGGHALYVTATCDEGFIVSSWGNKYLIPYSDLQKSQFTLDYFTLVENGK